MCETAYQTTTMTLCEVRLCATPVEQITESFLAGAAQETFKILSRTRSSDTKSG